MGSHLGRALLDVLLVGVVIAVLGALVVGRAVPLTGATTFIVAGGSMEPEIPVGSAVIAVPVAPADVGVGDVVSVQVDDESAIYTHRVVRLVERDGAPWLETKSDANAVADPAIVPAAAVVGRVAVALPIVGYPLWLLSIPVGIAFVVGLSATLFVAARLVDPGTRVDDAPVDDDSPRMALVRETG